MLKMSYTLPEQPPYCNKLIALALYFTKIVSSDRKFTETESAIMLDLPKNETH